MKYNMKRVETVKSFQPFTIELTFETEEEYVHFHDNVAGKLTKGSHQFIADVYRMGCGDKDTAIGAI